MGFWILSIFPTCGFEAVFAVLDAYFCRFFARNDKKHTRNDKKRIAFDILFSRRKVAIIVTIAVLGGRYRQIFFDKSNISYIIGIKSLAFSGKFS